MRLDDVEASDIEVRKGGAGKAVAGGGGILAILIALFVSQMGGGGGGGGGAAIQDVIGQMAGGGQVASEDTIVDGDQLEGQQEFIGKLRTLLDDYWETEAPKLGARFEQPGFVVFENNIQTGGCGIGQPEAGPFYCPADEKIYIDLGFYKTLEKQLDFDGDFALAYVMAHEYGHHIENKLGMLEGGRSNAVSVQIELQADCYAGAWGNWINDEGRISIDDFNDAIRAAQAVGDDAIQGANANQDTFTHGTSAQREEAFRIGFESGNPKSCRYR